MKILSVLAILGLLISCASPAPENKSDNPDFALFGEQFEDGTSAAISTKLSEMGQSDTMYATVIGEVVNVCQVKGCWMNVKTGYEAQEEVFVRFQDYGFFVPKDIDGQKVSMKGYFFRDVTSVEDLRHYAEDEGKSKEEIMAITEPEEAVNFIATGVKVYPES